MSEERGMCAGESQEETLEDENGPGWQVIGRYGGMRRVDVFGQSAAFALSMRARRNIANPAMLCLALLCHLPMGVRAWAGSGDGTEALYSASERRNAWMYDSNYLNMEFVGCVWGYVEGGEDYHEDFGCREDESEDGTYYWYQMANCRRAQVVYNVYAGGSCSSSTFKESYMTKTGLAEFIYTMNTYDGNSPLGNVDADDFPMCEEDGYGYYLSLGCSSDGGFTVNKFTDEYCLQYSGEDENYDLSDINSALQYMQSCYSAYDSSSGMSVYKTALSYLLSYSEPCTSVDYPLCTDSRDLGGSTGLLHRKNSHAKANGASVANKLKYVLGSLLLVASVTMFMGILFTNRRRRRAMMHRRFRQSASRSRTSRSRGARSSRSSRSKSRNRSSSRKRREAEEGDGGVFT